MFSQLLDPRFEMDYILAAVPKPYVAVMDGITSAVVLPALLTVHNADKYLPQWAAASASL